MCSKNVLHVLHICEETHLSAQSQLLNAVFLCPKTGWRRSQNWQKDAMAGETCGCVCVRVCLCFCKPHRCICMPYQIWLLREICASALVNRLYKLNIMRCATFTYHLFSGLGLGRDPGPGMNSAVWMHHTSTVLEGTYMAIIHFVLLIASFYEVTKEEHNTWSRC